MVERPGVWTLKARSRFRNSKLTSIAWKDKTRMHKMMIVMTAMALEMELNFRMQSL